MLIDLDHFKEINDERGHLAGDRFLRRAGEVIRDTMRSADVPCRYGGDEFCILLPETGLEGALSIAERIRQRRIPALDVLLRSLGQADQNKSPCQLIAIAPLEYP